MNFTRILAGASIVGAASLPLSWAVTGVAAADPVSPGVAAAGEPQPIEPESNDPQRDQPPPPAAAAGDGFALPPALAEQVNQAAASLPSPVQLNVPVSVGLPGIGLPGLGLTVPVVLGGLAAPSIPGIGLPALPQIGPPQLPSVGLPQLPF